MTGPVSSELARIRRALRMGNYVPLSDPTIMAVIAGDPDTLRILGYTPSGRAAMARIRSLASPAPSEPLS